MGNKVGKFCVPIRNKRKIKEPANFPSLTDLILENFLKAIEAPLPRNNIPSFLCQICCESKLLSHSFDVEGCIHFYCTICIAKYVVSKLQYNVLKIVCPESGCSGVLNPHYCKPILPNNVYVWWDKALSESVIPENAKFYCPFNDCSALLINNDGHKGKAIVESNCPHCKRSICVQCKAPWHTELTCEKFQRMKDKNNDLMLDLARRRNWRRCPNCKHYVEKRDGCNDIKCRLVSIHFSVSSPTHNVSFFHF